MIVYTKYLPTIYLHCRCICTLFFIQVTLFRTKYLDTWFFFRYDNMLSHFYSPVINIKLQPLHWRVYLLIMAVVIDLFCRLFVTTTLLAEALEFDDMDLPGHHINRFFSEHPELSESFRWQSQQSTYLLKPFW